MIYYHFAELIHRQAKKYGNRTALRHRDNAAGKWLKISWREFSDKVMLAAKAMTEFGIEVQKNIGVYSQNMPQCLYTDFGAHDSRVVSIPMYVTNSPGQIEYIINDAKIRTLFVGEQLQYNNAFKAQRDSKCLERLVVFDLAVKMNPEDKTSTYFDDFLHLGDNVHTENTVKIRMTEAVPGDLVTIIYTSGTTGESRDVMLPHSCYLEAVRIHDVCLPLVTDKDPSMSFLPITHIFEKAWCYYCLHKGATIAINQDPRMIQKTLPEVHPTLMCNVPRFQEKVYTGMHKKISSVSPAMKKVFLDTIETEQEYNLGYKDRGIPAPCGLKLKFQFYNKTVFILLKRVSDIERGRFFPVAGAPLPDTVNGFLQSVDIPVTYGYGLNEIAVTVCSYPEIGFQFDSIGEVIPGVQVKIDSGNNEILVKGETAMSGCYNKPEETKRTFTEGGFFRTGDADHLESNTLFFTGRIKDLYKTSNRKYIMPQAIEMVVSDGSYIKQITVVGGQREFVSALIMSVYPLLKKYTGEKGISFESREELVKNKDIIRFIEARVEKHQENLTSYEKIKYFALLPEPFMMGCELTGTLKLRRLVVLQKYVTEIEAMYKE